MPEEVTRRSFFGKAIAAIAGSIALILSVPILGYTILPALRKREEPWSEVGPVTQLEMNQPKELEVVRSVSSGWMKAASVRSIWAFRKPEGEVVVYSPICTHLGCGYHWDDQKKKFLCPCHNSSFDLNGQVLGGPAPRPLDALPAKVEGDRLYVVYKEFKSGISRKEEI
ncbi:MAG: ubiquinol-cytochrome c reductase iron-sulfur subunit [Nitrospirae bacterium]|nr:ubiquinol-cytochrome c reductase iron-sulfur subunit [Nitrospirota bacterium]MBI3350983.1 ubiquinol-cytochrome c reductase iron-sulfur subunit [Nitrospirota bacterium]